MGKWHKTGCVLCSQNCGLEVEVEDNKMVKVRPDKDNPRSRGYACRKGMNIIYHQYPSDRLKEPLKRVGDKFIPIDWEQATDEIAAKLKEIVAKYGPRSFAYMGASSQGGHLEGAFGLSLLKQMGSKYHYSSAAQEFSGIFWTLGRMLGKQYNVVIPDEHNTEMLVAWGWNGMESHQMPRTPILLKEFSKSQDKVLVVIDPRKSETAAIANIHLPIRPGTDALLIKAMIAIILENGWENREYIENYVEGYEKIEHWFKKFDIKGAITLCELEYEKVVELCRLMTTKKWCMHPDLGIYMGRNSAINSYLMNILGTICGIFCVSGGNVIPGMVMPMGSHADERNPKVWRTVTTNMPPVAVGTFPPSVMPEEILSDNPQKLRAVFVSACNPLRSYPDTTAYEKAFSELDLLVVNDIVMSETARFAHYVLPCRTFYESWDTAFFPLTFPEVYLQLRRPIVNPPEKCLESSQIFTKIADKLGLIPDIPENVKKAAKNVDREYIGETSLNLSNDNLIANSQKSRMAFGMELMQWGASNPSIFAKMPFVLAKTLGENWDSAAKAALWGLLMTAPDTFRKNAVRAGFENSMEQSDNIFQALIDNPQGLWVGKVNPEDNMGSIQTKSGKIEVYIPEVEEQIIELNAERESKELQMPKEFPLILNAGRHTRYNMNTMMRNPEWNKDKQVCNVAVSVEDADRLNLVNGESVKVTTEAGSEIGIVEVSSQVRSGMVLIPHGFGLIYGGQIYGINVNRLTKNTNRDFLGTPIHRFVPCRIEKI
ncbi:MAG: molybdopterin-dependent oxidoreductase [Desulfamplus sp.]|nr:molybdopterin-dependent oxidoreductase [Desulfamplus sp.]